MYTYMDRSIYVYVYARIYVYMFMFVFNCGVCSFMLNVWAHVFAGVNVCALCLHRFLYIICMYYACVAVHVCMRVYACAWMYVLCTCVYTCMHVCFRACVLCGRCARTYMYVCMHVFACTCGIYECVYRNKPVCVSMSVWVWVCVYVCVCVCVCVRSDRDGCRNSYPIKSHKQQGAIEENEGKHIYIYIFPRFDK